MQTPAQQAYWQARFAADATNPSRASSLWDLARRLASQVPARWVDLDRALTAWTGIDPAAPETVPTGLAHAMRRAVAAGTDRERAQRAWDLARLHATRESARWEDLVRLLRDWTQAVIDADQQTP